MKFDTSKLQPPWSFSRINTFRRCPWRAAQLYLAERPEPSTEAAQVGTAVHALVALFRRRYFELGTRLAPFSLELEARRLEPDPAVREKAVELLTKALPILDLVPPLAETREPWIENPWAVDETWAPVPYDAPGAYFRGVVDFAWVDGAGRVTVDDIKTGAAGDPWQLRVYAALACQNLALRPDTVRATFTVIAQCRVESSEFSAADLEAVPDWVAEQIAWITGLREFEPRVGSACPFCGFRSECPVYAEVGRELALRESKWEIADPEVARRAVEFVTVAEDYLGLVKDGLRRWVAEHGAVTGGGKIAELRESETWSPDVEAVALALLGYGLPREQVWSALGLTKTSLQKLLRATKRSDLLPELLTLGDTRSSTRFGLYKDPLAV